MSQESAWISAEEAAQFLGVKAQTLYAYVSRGSIRSRSPSTGERGRRYSRSDVERHRARSLARKGHAAVASGALAYGEPVLDTSITDIQEDGPAYRGRSAVALARADTSPERVAELLLTGTLPERAPSVSLREAELRRLIRLVPRGTPPVRAMLLALVHAEPEESREHTPARARELIRLLALSPGLGLGEKLLRARSASASSSGALLLALGARPSAQARRLIGRALVLSADHELNASTFAARIAAGSGADLPRCLSAALAVFTGTRHGGASEQVEAFIRDLELPEQALTRVRESFAKGLAVPGFGQPLYPRGDPRAPLLIEAAAALAPKSPRVRTLKALREAMLLAGGEPPNIDHAFAVVSAALGLPPGSASAIFAVGRSMGYVAHVIEQRESGQLLRPRARYVGA